MHLQPNKGRDYLFWFLVLRFLIHGDVTQAQNVSSGINARIMHQGKGLRGVTIIDRTGYYYQSDSNGSFRLFESDTCLIFKEGFETLIRKVNENDVIQLKTLSSPPTDTLELSVRNEIVRIVTIQKDTIQVRFDKALHDFVPTVYIEGSDSSIVVSLNTRQIYLRSDVLSFRKSKLWILLDKHHRPIITSIAKNDKIIEIDSGDRVRKEQTLRIKVEDISGPVTGYLESEQFVHRGISLGEKQLDDTGETSFAIDLPSDNTIEVTFFDREKTKRKVEQLSSSPDLPEQTFTIKLPFDLDLQIKEEKEKVEKEKRRAEEEKQRLLALEQQQREEQQRRGEGKEARRRRERREQEERAALLVSQKAVRVQLVGEYLRRHPKSSFTQQLQRPESNFSSFPQVSTCFDIENFVGSRVHLRTQISALALSGIGLGVSVSPVVNLIPTKSGFGVNVYLGGSLSFQGANLNSHVNGFRTGFLGVRLGFGRPVSKLDPGAFILEARVSLLGIPYINNQNEFKVETVDEFRLGGELAINRRIDGVTFGSIAFQYGLDNLFDSNFSFGVKLY